MFMFIVLKFLTSTIFTIILICFNFLSNLSLNEIDLLIILVLSKLNYLNKCNSFGEIPRRLLTPSFLIILLYYHCKKILFCVGCSRFGQDIFFEQPVSVMSVSRLVHCVLFTSWYFVILFLKTKIIPSVFTFVFTNQNEWFVAHIIFFIILGTNPIIYIN